MKAVTSIDISKSLAELTDIDWGVAPIDANTLVRERHEIRQTPIRDLTHKAIILFLDMRCDVEILVPVALERLREIPNVGLLCAVLRADHFNWRGRPEFVTRARDCFDTVINQIVQIDDDVERIQYEAAVWRFYALFERGMSAI